MYMSQCFKQMDAISTQLLLQKNEGKICQTTYHTGPGRLPQILVEPLSSIAPNVPLVHFLPNLPFVHTSCLRHTQLNTCHDHWIQRRKYLGEGDGISLLKQLQATRLNSLQLIHQHQVLCALHIT